MKQFRERAVAFGPRRSLVGILTTPAAGPPSRSPTVVIPNAGVIHRVGANRLHVRLARALAARGHLVLRFDLAGMGDSDPRPEPLDLVEAARLDMVEALDYLETAHDAYPFAVFGLCSGANIGFTHAVRDHRITNAVLLDPAAYPTWRSRAVYYARRLARPSAWARVFTGRHHSIRRAVARVTGRSAPRRKLRTYTVPPGPSKDAMREGLQALIDRGVTLLIGFTAGLERDYNYRSQFRDTFPEQASSRNIRVVYLPDADHTFTGELQKEALVQEVVDWMGALPKNHAQPTSPDQATNDGDLAASA